jgi:iron complex outermembrane receptor protein
MIELSSSAPARERPHQAKTNRCRVSAERNSGIRSFSLIATVAVILAWVAVSSAQAQRADENAIDAATDAFGTSVGLQTIGLYSPTNARGFNPTQAGNLRIEGLYFDQQNSSGANNGALYSGSEMRIGVAAQSYPFPSPTGIADYKLRTPGDKAALSAVMTRGPFDESTVQLDGQYPLIKETLSAGLNVLDYQDFDYQFAQRSREFTYSLLLRYRPSEHFEILPFYSYMEGGEHREIPFVYADGIHPAPAYQQILLPAEDWSSWGWRQTTAGVIARGRIDGAWSVAAGLFRSVEDDPQNFDDLLIGPLLNRTADHLMDVVPPLASHSYSGELRITRSVADGVHQHELEFTARARQVERHFGGDSVTDFGSVSLDRNAPSSEPPLVFSPTNRDDTHQTGAGIDYTERWQHVGALSLGLLKTTYARSISSIVGVSAPQRTSHVLPTVSFTIEAHSGVTLYGSYVRGLEDSAGAPPNAINRGEPPPATLSSQVDGGVRWVISGYLDFVLGGFEVRKPYFNLDTNNEYRQLGQIQNRGIEASATLRPVRGLKIIAGFVHNDPQVDLQATGLATARRVPVGPVPSTINMNADYAPSAWHGWGASMQWTRLSSRVETDNDLYELPPLSTLNTGVRFEHKCLNHPCSLRLDIANLTDASGLTISPQYMLLSQLRRNYMLTAAIDI